MSPLQDLTLAFLFLLSFSFLLLTTKRAFSKQRKKANLPPSPPKLPFIGNFHQVGAHVHQSLHQLSNKYGPLMLVHLGQVPTLVVSSRDMAREVMRTHDLVFASRPPLKSTEILLFNNKDIIFSPYGEHWRHLRKLCTVHLLSPKMVQSFHLVRDEEVAFMVQKIRKARATDGKVDLSKFLFALANDLICRMVSAKFSREEEGRNELFRELIDENVRLFAEFGVWDAFPSLAWLGFFSERSAKKNFKKWNALLDQMIEQHKKSMAGGGRDDEQEDFVHVLLSLQDNEILEQIKPVLLDIFAAATDTTSITLEWAMAEIVRNPYVKVKLQDEVRRNARHDGMVTTEELSTMRYLKAVVKETLRLHPAVPLLLPRESMSDCRIGEYEIPKKTRVLVNAWAIGRDPKSWETPEEFKPERFIDSLVDFKGNDFEFIPFGAGRRICPGMLLAVANIELAIANLMLHFDWMPCKLAGQVLDMTESPGATSRKKEKLQLIAIDGGL